MISEITANKIIRLYQEDGLPMHQIAKELKIAVGSVFNCLKRKGIETRPPHIGFKGKTHTKEARKKMSDKNTGKIVSEETRRKISEARKLEGPGHKKKRDDGYISIYYPKHPDSNAEGYILEHRLVMERHIGRRIRPDEVVHHKNHDRADNRIENLELLTFKEHAALHMRERHQLKGE